VVNTFSPGIGWPKKNGGVFTPPFDLLLNRLNDSLVFSIS